MRKEVRRAEKRGEEKRDNEQSETKRRVEIKMQ